jgi:hypothetical protein
MADEMDEKDLAGRLKLIENMMAEGRRTTERWGWVFVLWGVAYYVAIFWTSLGHFAAAWPVTMTVGWVLTVVIALRKASTRPKTTMGRAVSSIWIAMGISMFVLFPALSFSGRINEYIMVSVAAAMMGMANAASAILLRWWLQFACAVIWWATAAFACFGRSQQVATAFLVAIFLCLIAFGLFGMVADARQRKLREVAHA